MHWGSPSLLVWLWLAPVIAVAVALLWRYREQGMQRLFHARVLDGLLPEKRVARAHARLVLWCVAMTLCLVALARPQWGERWIEVQHKGMDILVVLDTSNSMRAQDFLPSRLDRAKLALRDFVQPLRGDRIGVLPFAGDSYLYCPLTSDYGAFLMMLDDIYPGIVPRGGTAIEKALRRAIQSFDDQQSADRVILLITDGEDHEGSPLQLVDELRRKNIRVFVIGIGSPEGELIPIKDERGRDTFLRDQQGNVIRSTLQEDILERLATRTGGMYVRATQADLGLERMYEERLASMQRAEMDTRMIREHEDRFAWFVGAALVLLALECFLRDGVKRASPSRALLWIGAVIFLYGLPDVHAQTLSARDLMKQGLSAYEEGSFEDAAAHFQDAAEAAPDEKLDGARAHFNRGNALLEQDLHEEAASEYQAALESPDLELQHAAHFNRGNALLDMAEAQVESMAWQEALDITTKALESYRNALALRSDDEDAKINHEWAARYKKQLEEIIEQMPPQESQDSDENNESEDEEKEDNEENNQQQDQQEQQDQQDQEPQEDESSTAPPLPPQQEEQEPQGQPGEEKDMEDLNDEEIQMILDAMRQDEQATRDRMRLPVGDPEAVLKDW